MKPSWRLAEVKNRVAGEAEPVSETAAAGPAALSAPRILWVDDNPKGNSFLVEQIRAWGAEVDLAESTSAGLAAFAAQDYQAVISDMVRKENGSVRDDAGMQLLLQIRQRNPGIPFFVFCSPRNARRWGSELKNAGAQGVTASETELLRLLQLEARKRYGMK